MPSNTRTAYGADYDRAYQEHESLSERKRRAKIVSDVTNRLYKGQTKSGMSFVTFKGSKELENKIMHQEMKNMDSYYRNGGGMSEAMRNSQANSFSPLKQYKHPGNSATPMRYSSKFASRSEANNFW